MLSYFQIDPDYYGRELCVCQNHHYKDAGSCVACPSNANCDEGTLIIDRGYFPIVYQSNGQNRTDVAECFEVGRNETSCNPDSSLEYECAEGYEDYLCSKCMNGYFMESRLCSVCPSNSKSYGYLAIAIFVLVVVFWYFLSRPFQPGSERDLIPPSALFCVQATNILISTIPMRWPQIASKSNSFLLDWSNASLNWLSCLNVTLFQREYSLHFYTEVVSSLIIFSVLCASIRPIRVQAVRMIFRVLNCSYLMLAVQTLQVFGCGEEAHTGRTYVLAMPWVSCDPDDETYKSMYLVGIQTLLVFVFGVPMLQLYLVWRAASWGQARPYQPDGVCAWINHQLYKYHDGYLFWEVWVYFRRLIIAFLVVPLRNSSGDSTPVRSFLLVVVIAGNLGAHVYFMPFLSKTSNMLEILSLSTVLFIYTCGNIFSLYDDDSFVQYCFVAYLFMVFLVFALVIVVQLFILYLPQVLGETRVVDTIIEYDQEEVRRWQVYESDSSEGDATWFRWSRSKANLSREPVVEEDDGDDGHLCDDEREDKSVHGSTPGYVSSSEEECGTDGPSRRPSHPAVRLPPISVSSTNSNSNSNALIRGLTEVHEIHANQLRAPAQLNVSDAAGGAQSSSVSSAASESSCSTSSCSYASSDGSDTECRRLSERERILHELGVGKGKKRVTGTKLLDAYEDGEGRRRSSISRGCVSMEPGRLHRLSAEREPTSHHYSDRNLDNQSTQEVKRGDYDPADTRSFQRKHSQGPHSGVCSSVAHPRSYSVLASCSSDSPSVNPQSKAAKRVSGLTSPKRSARARAQTLILERRTSPKPESESVAPDFAQAHLGGHLTSANSWGNLKKLGPRRISKGVAGEGSSGALSVHARADRPSDLSMTSEAVLPSPKSGLFDTAKSKVMPKILAVALDALSLDNPHNTPKPDLQRFHSRGEALHHPSHVTQPDLQRYPSQSDPHSHQRHHHPTPHSPRLRPSASPRAKSAGGWHRVREKRHSHARRRGEDGSESGGSRRHSIVSATNGRSGLRSGTHSPVPSTRTFFGRCHQRS
eukprot:Rmarinus@m.13522